MKYWYHNSGDKASFYHEPINWHKLISLFDGCASVIIEHFIGTDPKEQTIYKSWHGSSLEFMALPGKLKLYELTEMIERLEMYPYEYILNIEEVRIQRSIIEGAVFTGKPEKIRTLIDKLAISPAIINKPTNGELIAIDETGIVLSEGTYLNCAAVLDYIYNDIMTKENSGYHEFMESLESANIIKE